MATSHSPAGTCAIDYAEETQRGVSVTADASLRRPSSATRLDSDRTLHGPSDSNPESPSTPVDRQQVLARCATEEDAAPVAARPVLSHHHRKSTGATHLTLSHDEVPIMEVAAHGYSSSEESLSESEDVLRPQKSHSASARSQLSTKRLNQTRQRPGKRKLQVGNTHFQGLGQVARDGRLKISVNETVAKSGYLSKALGATITRHLHPNAQQEQNEAECRKTAFDNSQAQGTLKIPPLNIVIIVIGSRGDIQPFLKIGRILKDQYNHRVRVATHPAFRKFVEEEVGLEFFSIKGDPSRLMVCCIFVRYSQTIRHPIPCLHHTVRILYAPNCH